MKTATKFKLMLLTCAPLFVMAQAPGLNDMDGYTVPDSIGNCLYVKGQARFNCPVQKNGTVNDDNRFTIGSNYCPDFFGNDNAACPQLENIVGGSLYYSASFGVDRTAEAASSPSEFTQGSATAQTNLADFKEKLELAISDSKDSFAHIKGKPYKNDNDTFETSDCLPGAYDCFIFLGSKKLYLANFGVYKDGMEASDKANELKRDLLQAIGKTEWHFSVLGQTGYVEEYEVWRKTTSTTNYTRIRTYLQKVDNKYNVYLTVEDI